MKVKTYLQPKRCQQHLLGCHLPHPPPPLHPWPLMVLPLLPHHPLIVTSLSFPSPLSSSFLSSSLPPHEQLLAATLEVLGMMVVVVAVLFSSLLTIPHCFHSWWVLSCHAPPHFIVLVSS
jgi:hypothetical protein